MRRLRRLDAPLILFLALFGFGCATAGGAGDMNAVDDGRDGSGDEPSSAQIANATGRQYLLAGDYAKAISELRKAVSADPSLKSAWMDLGEAQEKTDDFVGAAGSFEQAYMLDREDLGAMARAGYDYGKAKAYDDAIIAYETVIEHDPEFKSALMGLGAIYRDTGEHDKAVEYFQRALDVDPTDALAIRTLASHYEGLAEETKMAADEAKAAGDKTMEETLLAEYEEKIHKAASYYELGIENAPDRAPEFRRQLGTLYYSARLWKDAIPVYRGLLATDPDNLKYNFNIAVALDQAGQKADALPYYEKVLEVDPTQTKIYVLLANAYSDMENYDSALKIIKEGLDHAPDQAAGLYCSWGGILEKQSQYEEAIEKFKMAQGDPQWGSYATKQIDRQGKLIKRRDAMRAQEEEGY